MKGGGIRHEKGGGKAHERWCERSMKGRANGMKVWEWLGKVVGNGNERWWERLKGVGMA